jgi:glutamine amidotransferase
MITIIDYGVGNINAFQNIYKTLGKEVCIAKKANDLKNASKLILPGVGHFDYAMNKFNNSGMLDMVEELVKINKIPILGICVGMQMLANISEEGILPGLGWIDAVVKKIDTSLLQQKTRLPHMGWNDINIIDNNPLFFDFHNMPKYYFLHSYYFHCKQQSNIIATATYGNTFACAVNHNNIFGVQFHPEKSHLYGIKLLENFSNL